MAERRMFAKKIVESARFIKMPPTSQNLYFHLGMNADDDGIVEAFTTIKMLGNVEDDLRILVAKGFVRILNEDLVTQIMDWKSNNLIRQDRYTPSIYKDLMIQVGQNDLVNQRLTQVSIDKLSKDKNILVKHKYGEYKNVVLDDEQLSKLKEEFPKDWEERIERVSEYVQSTGKTYKDYLATIRVWARKEKPIEEEKPHRYDKDLW